MNVRASRLLTASGLLLALPPTVAIGGSRDRDEAAPDQAIEIEVVVTDRHGEPVSGLGTADFEAEIDGSPVRIVTVTPPHASQVEANGGETPQEILSLLIYADNYGIDLKRRSEVLERLRASLGKNLGKLDRVMVVAAQGEMAGLEPLFTDSTLVVEQALERIERSAPVQAPDSQLDDLLRGIERLLEPAQNRFDPESERDSQTIAQQLRAYAAQQRQRTLDSCRRLKNAVDTLVHLPGRRAIVYVGAGMPLNAGEDLLQAMKNARPARRQEGPFDGPDNSLPVDLGESAAGVVQEFARYASLNDVRFFLFNVGDRPAAMFVPSETGIADAGSSQPGENFSRPSIAFSQQTDPEASLQILATETGGLSASRRNAVESTLQRLFDERQGTYTLAFIRPDSAPGTPHSIEVRTQGRRLNVRHRKSFRNPSEDDRVVDLLRTALIGGATPNPLEARVAERTAGPLEGRSYEVHLSIRVPVEHLALEPLQASHRAQITVFIVSSDGRLWTSPIHKVVLPITIPNEEILAAMGRSIDYQLDTRIFEGRRHLAVAVRDDIDPTLSVLTLEAPPPGEAAPSGR